MFNRRLLWHLLLVNTLGGTVRPPRFEPLPICSHCIPTEDILAPGIGIDLTTSYGTAAVKYNDGSMVDLGKVDAPKEYIELMRNLSKKTSKADCSGSAWDEVRCFFRHTQRRLNKIRGLPATADVGIIADLITQLRTAIEAKLGAKSVERIVATVPGLHGLNWEDLKDAIEYAGLSGLRNIKDMSDLISELSAAFAGMGYGLCTQYNNTDACEGEDVNMPFSYILELSFNHASFGASYTYTQTAYRSTKEKEVIDFDLGFDLLPTDRNSQKLYWEKIRNIIVPVGQTAQYPLTHVLLLGDTVDNDDYIQTVQDALRELNLYPGLFINSVNKNETFDPVYIAARGAAEFAKRNLGSPGSCNEPPECAKNRTLPVVTVQDQYSLDWEL